MGGADHSRLSREKHLYDATRSARKKKIYLGIKIGPNRTSTSERKSHTNIETLSIKQNNWPHHSYLLAPHNLLNNRLPLSSTLRFSHVVYVWTVNVCYTVYSKDWKVYTESARCSCTVYGDQRTAICSLPLLFARATSWLMLLLDGLLGARWAYRWKDDPQHEPGTVAINKKKKAEPERGKRCEMTRFTS